MSPTPNTMLHSRRTRMLASLLTLLTLVFVAGPPNSIRAAEPVAKLTTSARPPKNNILILVTRNPSDPWAVSQVDGMVRFFESQVPAFSPLVEYMDWQNGGRADQENRLADYYAAKFAGRKIRTVIAQGPMGAPFLIKFHDRLFPEAQVVFCGIGHQEKVCPPWLTGVLEPSDAPGSFRLARALQPDLRRMVILEDPTSSGRAQRQIIEAGCIAEAPEVSLELLKTDTVQQLFAALETLPKGTAVLMNRARLPRQFMQDLRDSCPVPIYGLRSPLHLPGILGGSLLNGEEHGAAAADIAWRLFHGMRADEIPVATAPAPRLTVNYDQMKRFGSLLSALPEGTEVLGEPAGVFKTHGRMITIAAAIVAVLLATVVSLIWLLRQKRASAKALSRSLSTLNATFGSISDGVLVEDLDGRVASFNERFIEMWKIPRDLQDDRRDEFLLTHVLRHLKDPNAFLARVKSLYAHPEESSSDIIEFRDGRILERDSRPQRDEGKIVGRVWSFRDITARISSEQEKHQLLEQLAHSQKMEAVGTLAGGIAHDFNNILTGVIGYAELAKARLPSAHPSFEDLGHVLSAGERARELVRRILTFSRKPRPEKHAVSLKPIITEILQLIRATIPASMEIHADLEETDDCVLADAAQIHQSLLNLATNAMHAMGRGPGTLNVSLKTITGGPQFARENPRLHDGRWVRVSVSDTGHGMDPLTLRRIFEPFYTTKQPNEGTGLGLSVVHGIVTAHGGIITVESTPGTGSTFRLHFPLAEKPADAPAPRVCAIQRGHGENVLIVEDEAEVAEVARNFLTSLGYRSTICHSPEQALEEFRINADDYAAVLTDFSMPRMNGLDLVRQIHLRKAEIPCVLCTGYVVSAATETEASLLGVLDVVHKPYSRHDLATALARALRSEKVG